MTNPTTESGPRWLPRGLRKHFGNFSFLLIVLLLMLLLHPFVSGERQGEFFSVGFTLAFLAGLYAVRSERRTLVKGLFFAIPAIVGSWASYIVDSTVVFAISRAFEVAFILFVTWVILRYIMTEREVTTDTVYGAVCAYILIGLVFAIAYGLLEMLEPGSFRGITMADPQLSWDFTYFSLVTMTTLGYGDITPVHEMARSMATLQAITGQFYVAVLVARIVAIMSSKPSTS